MQGTKRFSDVIDCRYFSCLKVVVLQICQQRTSDLASSMRTVCAVSSADECTCIWTNGESCCAFVLTVKLLQAQFAFEFVVSERGVLRQLHCGLAGLRVGPPERRSVHERHLFSDVQNTTPSAVQGPRPLFRENDAYRLLMITAIGAAPGDLVSPSTSLRATELSTGDGNSRVGIGHVRTSGCRRYWPTRRSRAIGACNPSSVL